MKLPLARLFAVIALVTFVAIGVQYGLLAALGYAVVAGAAHAHLARPAHLLGANTFDAALVIDVARDAAINTLQPRLASVRAFSRDFSADVLAPKKTIHVSKAISGAVTQKNPTNFETGDSQLGQVPVTVDEYSKSFHITNDQLQKGFRLQQLLEINLATFANDLMDVIMAPLTVANFPSPLVVTAPNFGTDDLTVLFAKAANFNQRNLVLDGAYLAQFIPTDKFKFALGEAGAYGFDSISMNNRWNGAGPNVKGLVCDPQALAVASGVPVLDPAIANLMIINEVIDIPVLGLSIKFNVWGSLSGRTIWGSYGVMFGGALGDTNAAGLITSM